MNIDTLIFHVTATKNPIKIPNSSPLKNNNNKENHKPLTPDQTNISLPIFICLEVADPNNLNRSTNLPDK